MTSRPRLEQDLPEILGDLYLAGVPDYRDDLLRATAGTRQRPAWTYPTRWIPVDITARRLPVVPLPWRTIAVAALILILAAAALLVAVGSQRHVPPPFGPARNGPIGYSSGGDLFARDAIDAPPRQLITGPGDDAFLTYSPDGSRFSYSTTLEGKEWFKVAGADGSHSVQVFPDPLEGASASWAPNSQSIALITNRLGTPTLFIVQADGSAATPVNLGIVKPSEVSWRPPDGATLLIRGEGSDGRIDLYSVKPDGSGLRKFGLPSKLLMGAQWDVGGATWSPSGEQIAYNQVEQDARTRFVHFRVHLVNPDGTGDRAVAGPTDDKVHEAWPAFSPDGRSILVHRWTWSVDVGGTSDAAGWLALLGSDGKTEGHDIGPRIPGGEHTGLSKAWSPDGTRILMRTDNSKQVYSIDPTTGSSVLLPWAGFDLPDTRRLAP